MTPRTSDQFEQIRHESRERILESALAVFARTGFDRSTVREIAREAGVSNGLMYNYFRSKEDLLRAIFERGIADVQASFAAAPMGGSPAEQLEAIIRSSFEMVRKHREFWRVSYAIRHQPAVLEGLGEGIREWAATVESGFAAPLGALGARDPQAAARALFALVDGVAQHVVLDPENYPLDQVVEEVVQRFARPVARHPTT